MEMRTEIIDSAARAFFVQAWASWCDEHPKAQPRAGGGQDWMEHSPPTPPFARKLGVSLIDAIERKNGSDIETIYKRVAAMPGKHYREPTPDQFGHYLAMEVLGHGVGWSDDHPDHGLKLPRAECYVCDNEGSCEGYVSDR